MNNLEEKSWKNALANSLDSNGSDSIAIFILRIGSWANLAFVAGIVLMGLSKLLQGANEFFGFFGAKNPNLAIASLMSGLEFYLLAPLGYLLLRTLGNYIYAVRENQGFADEKSSAALMSVKGLTTGLLVAVLSTHLVAVFLKSEQENGHGEHFPLNEVLAGAALLLVLIVFFLVIEYFCHPKGAAHGRSHPDSPPVTPPLSREEFLQSAREAGFGDPPQKPGE